MSIKKERAVITDDEGRANFLSGGLFHEVFDLVKGMVLPIFSFFNTFQTTKTPKERLEALIKAGKDILTRFFGQNKASKKSVLGGSRLSRFIKSLIYHDSILFLGKIIRDLQTIRLQRTKSSKLKQATQWWTKRS